MTCAYSYGAVADWKASAVRFLKKVVMPSPFPGMDPYLENPEIFPDVHDSLITYLRESIQASLPAPYVAVLGRRLSIEVSRRSIGPDVEVRHAARLSARMPKATSSVGVVSSPVAQPVVVRVAHDEIREPFIEIYAQGDEGKRLVASIEVLSILNKTPGEHGRDLYQRKQEEILASQVHLVEIDLLRGGEHTTAVPFQSAFDACGSFDYHVSVHGFDDVETFFVYPIRLEERLPAVAIPLLPGDSSVTVDLQAVFDRCYDTGPYAREIRYGEDAVIPSLQDDQAAWAARAVQAALGELGPP
jgi:Protein of unknown function (DUF4058)